MEWKPFVTLLIVSFFCPNQGGLFSSQTVIYLNLGDNVNKTVNQ